MIDCMIEKHNGNLYIAGRFFHLLGSGIYHVCIPLFLLDKTNSLISTTIYFTIIHIPTLLSLLFIGVWLEKRDLKKCLLISNFLSFSIYLIIYLFIVERTFDLNFYIIISFLENINYSAYNVINSSIFSRIIKKDNIEKTNGKKSVFENIAYLISPALGAALYGSFGMQLIILLNILLVIFIYFLNNRIIYIKEKIQKSERRIFKQFFADGIKYIFSDEVLLSYFVLFMLMNFLVGPTEEIFAPTIIKTLHGFSNINYGWTGTFISLGIVIASVILTFNLNKKISLINCFYVQAIIMIITGILSIFLMKNNIFFFVIYLFLCFLSGYFSTFVNVPLISKFQMLVEQKYQTRFFSNLSFFSNLMIPLGIAFAGIMCEVLRSDVAYMFNGILMVVCIKVLSKKSIG